MLTAAEAAGANGAEKAAVAANTERNFLNKVQFKIECGKYCRGDQISKVLCNIRIVKWSHAEESIIYWWHKKQNKAIF